LPLVTIAGPGSRLYTSEESEGEALFADDFSSGNLTASNSTGTEGGASSDWNWSGNASIAVVASTLCGGTYAVRFRFGPDAPSEDSSAELRLMWGSVRTEFWARYLLHIPSNYTHRDEGNNKGWFTVWDEGDSGSYGSSQVGLEPNFWANGDGTSKQSVYVFGANGVGDTHYGPTGNPEYFPAGNDGISASDLNKTLEVVLHYKYASSANNNGVVEVWKRRLTPTTLAVESSWIKLIEFTEGAWYTASQVGFGSSYILGWANSGFLDQTDLHLGDFSIATTNIYGVE
jgi:hypothetical protein